MESIILAALFGALVTWLVLKEKAAPSAEPKVVDADAELTRNDLSMEAERTLRASEKKMSDLISLVFAVRKLRTEFSDNLVVSQDKELTKAEEAALHRALDAATFYLYVAQKNRIYFTGP
ncbi:hypothetical protein [Hyalangium rubrum]|uniref:Uncharacterized protein n=1 Tax=Hyalangium rubrum TaxID=3103134 RepID=A0ABU5H6P5_9BACT|nr:hypothetical protein [Hyalangium sp. s54d21]MDY7229145.1 hypothetical protein [Hyalangium sp. s54d21]